MSPSSSPPVTSAERLLPPSTPCSPLASHSLRSAQYFADEHGGSKPVKADCDCFPLHIYVYEIVRRSRTTRSVLQSAICYIEAVRPHIPAVIEQGRLRNALEQAPRIEDRIEVNLDTPSNIGHSAGAISTETSHPHTRTLAQHLPSSPATSLGDGKRRKRRNSPSKPLPPLPDMPSPLLCPRRSFLAALILATKFIQDQCCSNRHWAKLSGLEPREVGRCKRALGEALDWRLWVGKPPSSMQILPRQVVA